MELQCSWDLDNNGFTVERDKTNRCYIYDYYFKFHNFTTLSLEKNQCIRKNIRIYFEF